MLTGQRNILLAKHCYFNAASDNLAATGSFILDISGWSLFESILKMAQKIPPHIKTDMISPKNSPLKNFNFSIKIEIYKFSNQLMIEWISEYT